AGVKASGGGNQWLSVPSVPGDLGPTAGSGPATRSTAAGAGPGAVSGSAAESGGASGGGSATGVGGGAGNGPGLTASTIYVGDAYDPDTASADAALGAARRTDVQPRRLNTIDVEFPLTVRVDGAPRRDSSHAHEAL